MEQRIVEETPESKMQICKQILMGIVKKSQIAKYWAKGGMTETPYFGQTMA